MPDDQMPAEDLTRTERSIMIAVRRERPTPAETIAIATDLPIGSVLDTLDRLEARGLVAGSSLVPGGPKEWCRTGAGDEVLFADALPVLPEADPCGWYAIDTPPEIGQRVDIYLGRGPLQLRICDVYLGRPDHSCGEYGKHCDSCPPDRDVWCDDLNKTAIFDPENEEIADQDETFAASRHVTHWRPAVPPPFGVRR